MDSLTPDSHFNTATQFVSRDTRIRSVNVVLLNWNACQDTSDCIGQFTTWTEIAPIVWVVDNASTCCDVDELNRLYPHIHLIRNEDNLGFAGGSNRGIEAAIAQNDAPVLLLNNDARLSESALIALLDTLDMRTDIGIVGPLLYDVGESRRLISAGSRNPIKHLHNLTTELPISAVSIVDYVSGSVALIRAGLVEKIGALDERYFFSGEVADFCRRARKVGFLTAVVSDSEAEHELDRSSSFRGTLYTYYIVRNRFLYIRNFYRLQRLPLLAFWALYGIALSLRLRLTGNAAGATSVWLGTRDGVFGRFGNQNERVLQACKKT